MQSHFFEPVRNQTEFFTKMTLEETLDWIEKFSIQFANEINFFKKYEQEHVETTEKLLTERVFKRYKGTALSLRVPYENYKNNLQSQSVDILEQGLLVQSWATLGAHLESTLQMFLAFYYRFYIQSKWRTWDEKAIKQISEVLTGSFKMTLEEIVENNGGEGLTSKIKRSFIDKAKGILKSREGLPNIEKITLSDLISFYFEVNVMEGDSINHDNMKKIRDYRNSIHSFQERNIGTWEEYNDYLKTVIMLIIDMFSRLPDTEIEESIPEWYFKGKSELNNQQIKWFDYKYDQ